MGGASPASLAVAAALSCLAAPPRPADGHGYLASPRSRNLRAFEETVWWPLTADDPEPESCPHCLNRGGSRARCGLVGGGTTGAGERNYDRPRNALGGPMPSEVQATWVRGQNVVLDVTLTAHHKGHFVFSACPISPGEVPTQECFDRHRLTFLSDLMHGANYDPNHPERAYIAPVDNPNYVPDLGSTRGVMDFSFNMLLPPDLHGDLVLIQWYYLTANSCHHEGYLEYDWPDHWNIDATSAGPCGDVSPDGTGVPEQFWNCAEVRILDVGGNDNGGGNGGNDNDDDQGTAASAPEPSPSPTRKPPPVVEMSSGIAIPVSVPTQSAIKGASPPSSAGSHGKTIVGYYASWQWYDRNKKAAPENMDFTKVQRVNFAFFQTDTRGNMWGTDAWADPNLLFGPYNWNPGEGAKQYCSWDTPTAKACNYHNYEQGLIHLVHAAGAEIYPSLGGWTLSDAFPVMAADAGARANFARNCVNLIQDYGFDGIDVDWEYPGYEDHSGTPQDKGNFRLLLDDVRAALDELGARTGRFYGLTAALPCGPRHLQNMDIAHVASTLSELNLMSYDFHGAFSETSGINAPMYYQGWGEEDFDVHSCVQNWLAGGGRRDKINIGLPFYGRSVGGATGLNQPHSGADKSVWGIDDGTPQYYNIVAKLPSMTTVWDEATWTPYAYFNNGGFVSFDDESAICVKVQYALENELGGFIVWELSGDLMEDLSTPLLDMTNKKLHNPDLNCGVQGIYPEGTETTAAVPTPSLVGQVPPITNPTDPTAGFPTPGILPTPSFPTISNPVSSPKSPNEVPGPETPGTFPTPSSSSNFNPVPSQSLFGQVPPIPNPTDPIAGFPTPGTLPTPSFPTISNPVSSPESLNQIPGPETPGTFPTPSFPSDFNPVPYPDSPKPHSPAAADSPSSQAVDDQPAGDQAVDDQPAGNHSVGDQPAGDQPVGYPSINAHYVCGSQQGAFDITDSQELDLSFRYELHIVLASAIDDAVNELKGAINTGVAEKLNCGGASVVRRLRSNRMEASQENVRAIETTKPDLIDDSTPCSIPVNLSVPTQCLSIIGHFTAHLEKETTGEVLKIVSEELLFFIRTSMASGAYESANIRKVIYIEALGALPVASNPATLSKILTSELQSEGGMSSSVAVVLSLLVVILSAFTAFVFRRSKKILVSSRAKEHAVITASPAANPTEESRKSALDTEEVWRSAMKTFVDETTQPDIGSDEEEVPDPKVGRGSTLDDSTQESEEKNQSHKDDNNDNSYTESYCIDDYDCNAKRVAPFEPDVEMERSDCNVEDEEKNLFGDCKGDVDDDACKALEHEDDGRIDTEKGHNQNDYRMDVQPLSGNSTEGELGSGLCDESQSNKTGEVPTPPQPDSADEMVAEKETVSSCEESNNNQGDSTNGKGQDESRRITSAEDDLD